MSPDATPISDLLDALLDDPAITPLVDLLQQGGACSARGGTGSSGVHLVAALAKRLGRPLVLVPAHLDDADEAVDELVRDFRPVARAYLKGMCIFFINAYPSSDAVHFKIR